MMRVVRMVLARLSKPFVIEAHEHDFYADDLIAATGRCSICGEDL